MIVVGVVYGYKGLLLIFGLFLAYETRSMKGELFNSALLSVLYNKGNFIRFASSFHQRFPLRGHVDLQRGGSLSDHGTRQSGHFFPGGRFFRICDGRLGILLLHLHGSHLLAQGKVVANDTTHWLEF